MQEIRPNKQVLIEKSRLLRDKLQETEQLAF